MAADRFPNVFRGDALRIDLDLYFCIPRLFETSFCPIGPSEVPRQMFWKDLPLEIVRFDPVRVASPIVPTPAAAR